MTFGGRVVRPGPALSPAGGPAAYDSPDVIGTTLGHYRIEAEAGRGGMGVVYRAQDTELGRVVALKVLRADAVTDPDRKRRFIHEAKAASALNHPGIVTIYQIGSEGTVDFIAMEFVAGRSLADIMGGRSLSTPDAVRYGIQIADALGAAHQAGIIHRDLKPANVMIAERGQIKILDFGVAKLVERALAGPTDATSMSAPVTEVGMVIGTAAYMSPEQSRGDAVDRRSDIFSFGVMLHEMLAGRRPEHGRTDALPAGVPRDLGTIVRRCLQPDPARRFQHVDDLRLALEDVDLTPAPSPSAVRPRRSMASVVGIATAVTMAALTGAGIAWWFLHAPPADHVVLRQLTLDANLTRDLAISSDGRLIAYACDRAGGNFDIWVQQVAGGGAHRLTDDPAADIDPSFSPDGSQIVFRSDRDGGGLYVVSALGGDERRIADGGRRPRWSPDGRQILFWIGPDTGFLMSEPGARVFVVAATGGQPRRIAGDLSTAWAPIWHADSRHVLMLGNQGRTPLDWWVTTTDDGDLVKTGVIEMIGRQQLAPSFDSFIVPEVWTVDGDVLFSAKLGDSTNIWRVGVGRDGTGGAGRLARVTSGAGIEVRPAVADNGQLVFLALTNKIDLWSLPANTDAGTRTGDQTRLSNDAALDVYPSFTRDGSRLVFASNRNGTFDLWVRETASGRDLVLASDITFPGLAIVAKNGRRVYYLSGTERRLQSLPLVGPSAAPVDVADLKCDECHLVWDLSSDERWALGGKVDDVGVVLRDVTSGRTMDFLDAGGGTIGRVRISPDDRWTSFSHRSMTRIGEFVAPFRPGETIPREAWIPITSVGETAGAGTWSPDGRRLYYFSDRDGHVCVWTQAIDRATGHPVGDPTEIWPFHEARQSMAQIGYPLRALAVSPDRIVISLAESTSTVWSLRSDR